MSEGIPSWLVGAGLDTDMAGDSTGFASRRFWMQKGSERDIIFLTEGNAAPVIWEHQVKLGFSKTAWLNFFSCLQMVGENCPICEWADTHDGQFKRYKAAFFTIVDCAEFTDRSGKKRKNERRMFCAKKETSEVLKRLYLRRLENDEGLKGAMYKVYRTNSDTSSSVGEQFEFLKMVDIAAYPEVEEFDYADILSPEPEKMAAAAARLRRESGVDDSGSTVEEGTETGVKF